MRFVTVSGPPSSGKTAVLLAAIEYLQKTYRVCVLKFDCLSTEDDRLYATKGITCKVGLSGSLCPDHYFVSNIEDCMQWAKQHRYDFLISESAGLCNRCSPHIKTAMAVCVIDNLMGVNTPKKIGPMLKMADIVAVTKGDIVSQAEREIFMFKIRQANPNAIIIPVNGITGQGASELAGILSEAAQSDTLVDKTLRVSMPTALCSYCLGEMTIGNDQQLGNARKMKLEQEENHA